MRTEVLLTVPELSDGTICLRRFRAEDAPAMHRNWAGDPCVTRYLRWPAHADVRETQLVVDGWVASYGQMDVPVWAIEPLVPLGEGVPFVPGEPIGSIGVVGWDAAREVPEVGYCVGRAWWGRGVATRALSLLLAFLFGQVEAGAVEAAHSVGNPASGAVMAHCGMRRLPGTEAGRTWRGPCEEVRCRMTRAEWLARAGAEGRAQG